jgi:hypothetical protein
MKSDDESLLGERSTQFELRSITWRSFQIGQPR